jgi:hypothetical protein
LSGIASHIACPCCNRKFPASELIIDARFLKLLEKYPGEDGCVIESDGSDKRIGDKSGPATTLTAALDSDVIDLCGDDDVEYAVVAPTLKREATDSLEREEERRVKLKVDAEDVIVID